MTRDRAPGRVSPTVVEILRDLNPLLGDRTSNRKWNLEGVNQKTLRRWFNGEETPSPAAARSVAASIWSRMEMEPTGSLRRDIMARLAAVLPSDPPHGWTEASFAGWFFERASGVAQHAVGSTRLTPSNPFLHRSAVRGPGFFGRKNELRRICDTIISRQNLQVVGAPKIGKSSLLREAASRIPDWVGPTRIAIIDMQLPAARSLAGWLSQVAHQWGWSEVPHDLPGFSIRLDRDLDRGARVVLILDHCDSFISLAREFPVEFFEGLRACSQLGMSIITGSQRTLRRIREQGGPLSPHYNTFSLRDLGPWHRAEAEEFVRSEHPGIPPFLDEECRAILDFGKCQPLRLQVASFHVVEARRLGTSLAHALADAAREMQELGEPEVGTMP